MKIVSNGIESQNDPDNENTSLLAGHAPRSDTGLDGSVDGEERNNQKWSGDKDFEGRPWWNKPSVRCICSSCCGLG